MYTLSYQQNQKKKNNLIIAIALNNISIYVYLDSVLKTFFFLSRNNLNFRRSI